MYDCFITLRFDPPLWLVAAVTQTALFFLLVLQFPGASFQCGNTCQDPSGVLTDIYLLLHIVLSEFFALTILFLLTFLAVV